MAIASDPVDSLRDGLLYHMPADGTLVYTVSGEVATGFGGVGFDEGLFGQALRFDGIDDYVEMPFGIVPQTGGSWTVAFWVDPEAQAGFAEYVSQGRFNGDAFYVGSTPSGTQYRVGDSWLGTGVPVFQGTGWRHLAVVNAVSTTAFYVDGELRTTRAGGIGDAPNAPFRVGRQYGNLGEYFQGRLDELAIYSRPLTSDEVVRLASGPVPPPPIGKFFGNSNPVTQGWAQLGGGFGMTAGLGACSNGPVGTGEEYWRISDESDAGSSTLFYESRLTISREQRMLDEGWELVARVVIPDNAPTRLPSGSAVLSAFVGGRYYTLNFGREGGSMRVVAQTGLGPGAPDCPTVLGPRRDIGSSPYDCWRSTIRLIAPPGADGIQVWDGDDLVLDGYEGHPGFDVPVHTGKGFVFGSISGCTRGVIGFTRIDLCDYVPTACNLGDFAEPFGLLDIDDVLAFLAAFAVGDPLADVAPPSGVYDIDDVLTFLGAFAAGCP